jgi:hypothetical protein
VSEQVSQQYGELLVKGTSMDQAGIVPGTTLFIDATRIPQHGDMVAAYVRDKGGTVKRWRVSRRAGLVTGAWLVPESSDPRWKPTRVDEDVRVEGVVVAYQLPGSEDVIYQVPRGPAAMARVVPPMVPFAIEPPPPAAPVLGGDRQLLPPLAQLLWEAQDKITRRVEDVYPAPWREFLSPHEFARAIGIDLDELRMIDAGHVPQKRTLLRMAARLSQLLDEPVTFEQLQAFARPNFFARRSE